jgi:hypothetical protein
MALALMDEPETGREPERARYSPALLHGTRDREGWLWAWGVARKLGHWPTRDSRDDDATLGTHVRSRVYGYRTPEPDQLADIARAYDHAGLTRVERDVLEAYYVEGLGGKYRDYRGGEAGYASRVAAYYAEHGHLPGQVISAAGQVYVSAVGDARVAERLHMARSTASGLRWRAIRKLCAYLNGERRGPG